jgi:signal transduction histidine kinase
LIYSAIRQTKKNINLILNLDANVPKYVLEILSDLKQILVNLLSNAIKFYQFGEICLDINVVSESKESQNFKFSVKDTGVGIQLANKDKIFNLFVQEDNSTNRKFEEQD